MNGDTYWGIIQMLITFLPGILMVVYTIQSRIIFHFAYWIFLPCLKEALIEEREKGFYLDFEFSKEGLWNSAQDIFWMFTGGLYLRKKATLKLDLYSSQRYLILESLVRAEQVWSLVFKIYMIKKTADSGTLVIVFLCFSVIKLALLNFYYSYAFKVIHKNINPPQPDLNNISQNTNWKFGWSIYLVNFMSQFSFVLFFGAIVIIIKTKKILLVMLIIPLTASCIVFMLTKAFLRFCKDNYDEITFGLVKMNNTRFMSLNYSFYDATQVVNNIVYGDEKKEIYFQQKMWIIPISLWVGCIFTLIICLIIEVSVLNVIALLVNLFSILLSLTHIYYYINIKELNIVLKKRTEELKEVEEEKKEETNIAILR